jgi:hypothetical protein
MTALARPRHAAATTRQPPPGLGSRADAPLAPTRFADRGVVLPATTPTFAFARVRDGEQGREIILRNATGSRGAVLMPLASAADYVRPTLHDRALFADILRLPRLGPAQVWAIARAAARAGLCGRSALAAAAAAAEAEARAARAALATLGGAASVAAAHPNAVRLAATASASRRLALLPPQLRVLAATAADRAAGLPPAAAEDAAFVSAAATATARLAERVLAPVLAALDDASAIAAALSGGHALSAEAVSRAGWVLDGWTLLLARWEETEGQGQAAEARAIRAIATALPPLPGELATDERERALVHATWRPEASAFPGGSDQALLERLRVAAP